MDLPKEFHKLISASIDADGVFPHHCLWLQPDGKLCCAALDLHDPDMVLAYVAGQLSAVGELVFGLDRYAREGQGTTLNDLITGGYWDGRGWRPFIIEYRHEPRLVKPLDWDNAFWNRQILRELAAYLGD